MTTRRFLVTAALPYSNGRLHVGHIAGAYLPADTFVRYLRSRGDDVRFICGSDDHGVAAAIGAAREGKSVAEFTRYYHDRQAADFRALGISVDVYGGTHHDDFYAIHRDMSQAFFRTIHAKGFFTKKAGRQFFDALAGQFLPDRFIRGRCYHRRADGTPCASPDATGEQCEACGSLIDPLLLIEPTSVLTGSRPELRETTHWYLQLDRLGGAVRDWLKTKAQGAGGNPAWREATLNFALAQIDAGLPERAMTRDLAWGIPVPLDDPEAAGKSLYVWFDAPIGYVSFTAELCRQRDGSNDAYQAWWKDPACRIVHFIGEDNVIFHAITWPAMLLAEGSFQLPSQVVANAFLNVRTPGGGGGGGREEKASKSRGTAVWVEDFLREYDADALRYYLTCIAPEAGRATFDLAEFVQRNNSELVGTLGNFIHRTLSFAETHCDGRVPPAGSREAKDEEQLAAIRERVAAVGGELEAYRFKAALDEVMALARAGNVYFDATEPWRTRKTAPGSCARAINVCLQTVRALTVVMEPFFPFAAARCAEMLNLPAESRRWEAATVPLPEGWALGRPVVLFRKIESSPSQSRVL